MRRFSAETTRIASVLHRGADNSIARWFHCSCGIAVAFCQDETPRADDAEFEALGHLSRPLDKVDGGWSVFGHLLLLCAHAGLSCAPRRLQKSDVADWHG